MALLFVKISEMKLDNFYHLDYSGYCLHYYIYNILANASFSLLLVFLVKFRSLHGTLNQTLNSIHGVGCSNSVNYNWVL